MRPDSVTVVLGSVGDAPAVELDGPPGTGVRLGAVTAEAAAVADDAAVGLAAGLAGLQAAATRLAAIAMIASETA
jgi:hypothetical protein